MTLFDCIKHKLLTIPGNLVDDTETVATKHVIFNPINSIQFTVLELDSRCLLSSRESLLNLDLYELTNTVLEKLNDSLTN